MEEYTQERRQYGRLSLLAYGQGRICTLEFDGLRCKADLIDISAGGARLRHTPPPDLPDAKTLVLTIHGVEDGGLLQKLSASIRWRNGQEIGVKFAQDLEVGVSTLQRLVC
ncbi:MAG: PilZ domain-containing protein [Humidesulfovibrio sp.]|nr:PilZ domain-containing protein [Humidesulfovibrio sp.]